jgi:lysozyme
MSIDIEKLADELKRDEGFRDTVYTCSAGKQTIGYGHNIEDNPIPERVCEVLLHHDIGNALRECERFPWFYVLDDVRKRVIVNMIFNIGARGVSNFRKMIAALEAGDYDEAATQMIDSKWYRQVGDRAERLVAMMRDG